MEQLFFNSQRSARQSPQMQHDLTQKVRRSKDLGKNTKFLNDRLSLETRFFQWRSYSAVNDTTTKPNGNDDGGLSEEAVRQMADNSRF